MAITVLISMLKLNMTHANHLLTVIILIIILTLVTSVMSSSSKRVGGGGPKSGGFVMMCLSCPRFWMFLTIALVAIYLIMMAAGKVPDNLQFHLEAPLLGLQIHTDKKGTTTTNAPPPCNDTVNGCCHDGETVKEDVYGTNCDALPPIPVYEGWQ